VFFSIQLHIEVCNGLNLVLNFIYFILLNSSSDILSLSLWGFVVFFLCWGLTSWVLIKKIWLKRKRQWKPIGFSCAKISKTTSVILQLNLTEYCIVLFVWDKLSLWFKICFRLSFCLSSFSYIIKFVISCNVSCTLFH